MNFFHSRPNTAHVKKSTEQGRSRSHARGVIRVAYPYHTDEAAVQKPCVTYGSRGAGNRTAESLCSLQSSFLPKNHQFIDLKEKRRQQRREERGGLCSQVGPSLDPICLLVVGFSIANEFLPQKPNL